MLPPLMFEPIFKQTIWGGDKLKKEFNKSSRLERIGESWELSCVPGNISLIKSGEFKGRGLDDVLKEYGPRILGAKVFAKTGPALPLLFKLIDAADDLSVQVHPGDKLAAQMHNSFGKTEMWYILSADKGGRLLSGFRKQTNKEEYKKLAAQGGIIDFLAPHAVAPGDAFFIPAGRVHAIGAGIVLAEVQQTSDITYRIFDYNRKGPDGNPRALHMEQAAAAIDFTVEKEYKTSYAPKENAAVNIAACDFFTVNLISLSAAIKRDLTERGSFIVYMCVDGAAELGCGGGKVNLVKGDTVLIPAESAACALSSKRAKLLEIYI